MSRSKPNNKKRRPRRKFTAEFKADVVGLCRKGNESIGEICRRLNLTETAVRAWVKQAEVDELDGTPGALTTREREELVRLRRDLKRVTQERDILKKATAFFAKESS